MVTEDQRNTRTSESKQKLGLSSGQGPAREVWLALGDTMLERTQRQMEVILCGLGPNSQLKIPWPTQILP